MKASTSKVDEIRERLCLAFSAELIPNGFRRQGHRSALDTLLMLAVLQANLAPLARDTGFQRTYAGLSLSPPDELRRPVRVRSIAMSLGIPQETARRRVASLAESGVLAFTGDGVIMPQSFTQSQAALQAAIENWRALSDLYTALRRAGALEAPASDTVSPEPPLRQMMRLWTNHFLRLIEALTPMVGEAFDVLLLFAILCGSGATLAHPGKPVSASALARSLDLPFETVRRNALRFAENDFCQKTSRGYLITPQMLHEPSWRALSERHTQILMRFFSVMRDQELLGWWEAEYQASLAPASV